MKRTTPKFTLITNPNGTVRRQGRDGNIVIVDQIQKQERVYQRNRETNELKLIRTR